MRAFRVICLASIVAGTLVFSALTVKAHDPNDAYTCKVLMRTVRVQWVPDAKIGNVEGYVRLKSYLTDSLTLSYVKATIVVHNKRHRKIGYDSVTYPLGAGQDARASFGMLTAGRPHHLHLAHCHLAKTETY